MSVPGLSGDALVISSVCGLSACDGTVRGPAGTFHFFVRVLGNLGPVSAASSAVLLPIPHDSTAEPATFVLR